MPWLIAREKNTNRIIRSPISDIKTTRDSGGMYESFRLCSEESLDDVKEVIHSFNLQWFIIWNQPGTSILKEMLKFLFSIDNLEKTEIDLKGKGK